MNAWLLSLLQTTDSFFPSGAYAHSLGLEGLVELGVVKDRATLETYLLDQVLPALEHFELPFLCFAHAAALQRDLETLGQLDAELNASRLPREVRQASASMGRQRLQMLRELLPHPFLDALHETTRTSGAHGLVVAGVQAALQEMPLAAMLMAHSYSALSGQVAASLKLIRIGQMASQKTLLRCLAEVPALIGRAQEVPREQAGWFSPVHDIACARHQTAYTRLFIS